MPFSYTGKKNENCDKESFFGYYDPLKIYSAFGQILPRHYLNDLRGVMNTSFYALNESKDKNRSKKCVQQGYRV